MNLRMKNNSNGTWPIGLLDSENKNVAAKNWTLPYNKSTKSIKKTLIQEYVL